jgi:hypothetical protein
VIRPGRCIFRFIVGRVIIGVTLPHNILIRLAEFLDRHNDDGAVPFLQLDFAVVEPN